MPDDTLVNVEQARVLLGGEKPASRSWVHKLVAEGKLLAIKYGSVRGLRIYRSSIDRYLRERKRDMAA